MPRDDPDPLRLRVILDGWARPEPGTMEIDQSTGTVRVWLREGEYVIPWSVFTGQMIELARYGALGPAIPVGNPVSAE